MEKTKQFPVAGLIAIGILVIAEIIARMVTGESSASRFEYGYDPQAGFVEHKNGTVDIVRSGGRHFWPHQSFKMPKPKGVIRIFTIGDSVPRGPSLKQSYTIQVRDILRGEGVDVEAFNLGTPGYGVRRNQIVLKRVLHYQPDVVILHLYHNNEYEDEREWRRAQDFRSWDPSHWLMKVFIFARLYEVKTEQIFWKWLPEDLRMETDVNDVDAQVAARQDEAQQTVWRERVIHVATQSVKMAEASSHVLLVLPASVDAGEEKLLKMQQKLERGEKVNFDLDNGKIDDAGFPQFAEGLQNDRVRIVRMLDVFKNQDPKKCFSDGTHMTPYGHELLAEAIARNLTLSGWLSSAAALPAK
jgi:hypothetical protein